MGLRASGRASPVCACRGCSRRAGRYRGSPGSGRTPSRSLPGAARGAEPGPAATKEGAEEKSEGEDTLRLGGDRSGGTHLLAHGFGVGDGGAEEAIPLQPPVEPGPVVVPVAGVGQAPGDEGVELPVCGVAGLPWGRRGAIIQTLKKSSKSYQSAALSPDCGAARATSLIKLYHSSL